MTASIQAELKIVNAATGTSIGAGGAIPGGKSDVSRSLKSLSRFLRRPQSIFGGVGGGGKGLAGIITAGLVGAGIGSTTGAAAGAAGLAGAAAFGLTRSSQDPEEIRKFAEEKGVDPTSLSLPGMIRDLFKKIFDGDGANEQTGAIAELTRFQKQQIDLQEEINSILVDGVENQDESNRLAELRAELDSQSLSSRKEALSSILDEEGVETAILDLNSQRLDLLVLINDGLTLAQAQTFGVANAQDAVNASVQKEIDLRRRLRAVREDKNTRTTVVSDSSTRLDTSDGRTFAIFDTPSLGGTRAFEIISR